MYFTIRFHEKKKKKKKRNDHSSRLEGFWNCQPIKNYQGIILNLILQQGNKTPVTNTIIVAIYRLWIIYHAIFLEIITPLWSRDNEFPNDVISRQNRERQLSILENASNHAYVVLVSWTRLRRNLTKIFEVQISDIEAKCFIRLTWDADGYEYPNCAYADISAGFDEQFFFFLFVTLSQCLFGKLGHNRTCTHCTLSLSQYYYCRQHETNNESSEWSRYNANVRDCHQGVFESWPKNSTDDHMSNLVFAVVLGRREDVPARYPDSRISKLENVPEIIVFTHRWIQSMAREKDVRWMGARFRSWKIRTRWEISGVEERGAQTRHTFGFRVTVREKRTGIEERCSGAMGRTFGQTTKRHERLVIELVRSFVRSVRPLLSQGTPVCDWLATTHTTSAAFHSAPSQFPLWRGKPKATSTPTTWA